ncbi:hypothetical protein ACA910_019903 [Epithemia clementina (nom. ined.)]
MARIKIWLSTSCILWLIFYASKSQGFTSLKDTSGRRPRRDDDTTVQVRILTWNILAQCYMKRPPPFLFGDFSDDGALWPAYTDWTYREDKIISLLSEKKSDVICLQEVQVAMLSGLEERWTELGYDNHIQDSDEGHPVTNVILISKALKWNVVFKESRSRALILGIQPSNMTCFPFFLVNVHLQASSLDFLKTAQTRFSQVQSLLKRMKLGWNKMLDELKQSHKYDRHDEQPPAIIIMGDFNFSPSDPLYMLLVRGEWPADDDNTNADDTKTTYKNHLPPKVSELSASSLPLLPLRDVSSANTQVTSEKGQHDLQQHGTPLSSLFWTYAPAKRVYDYIFVSDNVAVMKREDCLPSQLSKTLSYSAAAGAANNGKCKINDHDESRGNLYWPNKYHPSDHIPVGATVQIPLRKMAC